MFSVTENSNRIDCTTSTSTAAADRIDATFHAFAAQAERRRGPCIDWLRYVARWTQETAWPFETLTYVALGLSRDGQYFATATADVTPTPMRGQPTEARDGHSPAYEAALRGQIATDPAALTPRLAALDAVLESLVIPCKAP